MKLCLAVQCAMVLVNRKPELHSLANISVPDADDPHYNVTCYTYPLAERRAGTATGRHFPF